MSKVRLGEICTFQSGGTPSKKKDEYYHGTIPWITTVALNGKRIGETSAIEWITDRAITESAAKRVPVDSIMVGTRVGVGKVAINTVEMSTNQDIISLLNIDDSIWNKDFLCKFIQSKSTYLNAQARGATIKGIKIDVLSGLELPDMSISIQKRVSRVLDAISSMIEKSHSQMNLLDKLIKSRFVEMFGDCKTNPKNWKTVPIENIANVGSSKRVFVEELKNEGIPFFRGTEVGALAESKSMHPELFITEEHYQELINESGQPKRADLLMPSICPDGRIWLVNTDSPFYFKDGRVLWIHDIIPTINPTFLLYTLKDRIMTDYSSIASGTTFAELKIFALKKCKIFDVPIDLQNKFESFILSVNQQKATVQKSIDKLETLKKSLMQEYFG